MFWYRSRIPSLIVFAWPYLIWISLSPTHKKDLQDFPGGSIGNGRQTDVKLCIPKLSTLKDYPGWSRFAKSTKMPIRRFTTSKPLAREKLATATTIHPPETSCLPIFEWHIYDFVSQSRRTELSKSVSFPPVLGITLPTERFIPPKRLRSFIVCIHA